MNNMPTQTNRNDYVKIVLAGINEILASELILNERRNKLASGGVYE